MRTFAASEIDLIDGDGSMRPESLGGQACGVMIRNGMAHVCCRIQRQSVSLYIHDFEPLSV